MYPPNILLSGRYLVEKQIGDGHFAEVYLAKDILGEGEMVALKISKGSYGNQEEENEFLREAKHLFQLRHEHIIRLLDYRILDHRPLLVMEYVPYTLQEKYKPEGRSQIPLPPEEILSYLQQAASALQFAHGHDIVHQDVKPANILLNDDGLLKVSDFNISVFMRDGVMRRKLGGTEGYMAPERDISPAVDQYALGVVVYEGLLGHKPGFWISPRSLISRLFPASHVSAVLPIVLRALSKDPAKRFSDIQTFANQFAEAYKQAPHDTSNRLKRRFVVALTACLLVLISLGLPLLSLSQAVSHTPTKHVQTSTPNFQATQTAAIQFYRQSTNGVQAINSTLNDQDNNEWQVATSPTGSCVFTGGAYQASTQQAQTHVSCLEQAKMYKNCAFQVDLMIVNGDYGGVTVRADQTKGYYFLIGPDDSYKFGVLDGRVSHSLRSGLSPIINNKANQWNQLTVIALGNKLSFYINQRYIDQVSDPTSPQGMVGLVAEGFSNPARVMFRNVRLWSLP
jgi:serine/threonine protein kinase